MTDDKLKELEELEKELNECEGAVLALDRPDGGRLIAMEKDGLLDLIKSHRALEKESDKKEAEIVEILRQNLVLRGTNKELLEALKAIENIAIVELPFNEKTKALTAIQKIADSAYTKHSTDTKEKE